MRIVASRVTRVGGGVGGAASAGGRPLAERRGVLLALETDDGRVGWGEASPLPGFHRETVGDVEEALMVAGERLSDVDLGRAPLEELEAHGRASAGLIVRFAVETALLDLAAQARGTDIAEVLGGAMARRSVRVAAFAGELGAPGSLDRAKRAAARGARAIKLKTSGAHLDRDLESLAEISRVLPGVDVRLDLNGRLDPRAANDALGAYGRAGVALVEEPTAGRGLLALDARGAPWLADESLADPALALELLSAPRCAGFVVKPALLGLFEARRLATRALEAGKSVAVTHMFDGPIALAAACELALSLPRDPLACGLELHDVLVAYPPIVVPQLGSAAPFTVARSGRSGLGASLPVEP